MKIRDKATLSTRKELPNGFLRVDAVLARTGIQLYSAGELGLTDRAASAVVRVWRPAAEVFRPESMASFAMVPLTDNHPADGVDVENAKDLVCGWTGDSPRRDGDLMANPIVISSKDAIAKLDAGKVELSNGYDCELDWTEGVVPEGERDAGQAYDCVMRSIEGNHVALVDAGRCGADCRILDSRDPAPAKHSASDCSCQGDEAMADKALTKKMIDGVGLVEATDEAFAVIDSITKARDALQVKLDEANGAAAAAKTAHDAALAAKDEEIAALNAKVADGPALDALVNARAKLVGDAKRIGGDDLETDGKSDLEIQKAAVTAHMGDEKKVEGWTDGQFTGAFAYLAAQEPAEQTLGDARTPAPSGLRDALKPEATQHKPADGRGGDSYEDRMANRWKAGAEKKVA